MATIPVALLDRLLDREITVRESVCRELMRLFNSRDAYDSGLPALLHYGLPDWQQVSVNSEGEKRRLCQQIRAAVMHFEPRLQQVSVDYLPQSAAFTPLTLRINAVIAHDPQPLAFLLTHSTGGWQNQVIDQL